MTEPTGTGREDRDRRNRGGDVRRVSGTDGVLSVMNGAPFLAGLVAAAFILTFDSIDVLTLVHNAADAGRPISPWGPIVDEYSSGAGMILFFWLVHGALKLAWPGRARWVVVVPVHVVAASLFSALHSATMVLIRMAIHGLGGSRYHWSLSNFPYEYRKDVPAYLLIAGIFWTVERLMQPAAETPAGRAAPTFDIVDGARTTRVTLGEIVSAHAAGNYVEFHLADGRNLMMRATLAEVERGLASAGFLRTHRSWIVGSGHVRQIEPAGSGDYRVTLDDGRAVPVSRRYPEALARLRAGGLSASGATDKRSQLS